MNVYKAISAVAQDMSKQGISKDGKNQQQGFAFRGIDQVFNTLAPVLVKHGLVILPRVQSRSVIERQTKSGGALFYTVLEVEYDFVCAEDGSKHTVRVVGEAMDSGDKSSNKAMSAAYKYACFQAFCIPTEGDNDADATTHDVKAATKPLSATQGVMESLPSEEQEYIQELAMTVVDIINNDSPAAANEHIKKENLDADQKTALWSLLDSKTRSALKKG